MVFVYEYYGSEEIQVIIIKASDVIEAVDILKSKVLYPEYYELKQQNFANRVIISFSQVYFNKRYDEGLFNLWFSCSFNAGLGYAVYVKKENNSWLVKKVFVSYIR